MDSIRSENFSVDVNNQNKKFNKTLKSILKPQFSGRFKKNSITLNRQLNNIDL